VINYSSKSKGATMENPTNNTRKKIDPNDCWLTPTAAAKRAGCSRDSWYRWGRTGSRPAPDGYSPSGTPVWRASTVDRLFEQGSPQPKKKRTE
jgi:hypothetical protein